MTPASALVPPAERSACGFFEAAVEIVRAQRVDPAIVALRLERQLHASFVEQQVPPFEAFLRTLQAWKPSTFAVGDATALRILSRECPLAQIAGRDPSACRACQRLQVEILASRLGVDPGSIQVVSAVAEGADRCEFKLPLGKGG